MNESTHGAGIELRSSFEVRVDEVACFRRTISGHNESEHHLSLLRPVLARLLTLIGDGQSIDELAHFVRANELPELLAELVSLGFIEPMPVSEAEVEAIDERTTLSPMGFETLRREVLHSATELLGADVRPYLEQLYAVAHSGELRLVIDALMQHIALVRSESDAKLFIQTIRSVARLTR
ncbi:MAG: hypothetical protein EAZ24_05870 [Burkholderiales bacterium]|nr:MAG: hypothetical protein EAZ24_05870 [Burkholderiales bacterium]